MIECDLLVFLRIMFVSLLLALLLDYCFAEPKRYHPLVGFGRMVNAIEARLNSEIVALGSLRLRGLLAWSLAVMPWVILAYCLEQWGEGSAWLPVVSALVLYLAIGWQSLLQHAQAIAEPLLQGDLPAARQAVAMIVSRDTASLDEEGIAKAATESVLENGSDAIFAAIFWFCVAGIPGVVLYRLSNTLDAMWGYKTPRFLHFGWAAARIDDVLNFVPARLTALAYILMGKTQQGLYCWQRQGTNWKSPNAGPVMAAGAGALGVRLGGVAVYHQQQQQRPDLGAGEAPQADTIVQACALVNRSLFLWAIVIFLVAAF